MSKKTCTRYRSIRLIFRILKTVLGLVLITLEIVKRILEVLKGFN